MRNDQAEVVLEIFSTCPQAADFDRHAYAQRVIDVARWSERHGCRGILVYSDNRQLDPWLVAHLILQHTQTLCPLVAVQPVYTHPYAVAKMVATLAHLYGRRVYLNMVAGGFKNDLTALHDGTPHDRRYDRLIEYTLIIRQLLEGTGPVSFDGDCYTVKGLHLTPAVPPELFRGQLTHQLAMKVSDSIWHRQLAELAKTAASAEHPYWLVPFENYKTMCPYLVGSYERVGDELSRYMSVGYRSFILDIPPTQEELHHTNQAFRRALTLASR